MKVHPVSHPLVGVPSRREEQLEQERAALIGGQVQCGVAVLMHGQAAGEVAAPAAQQRPPRVQGAEQEGGQAVDGGGGVC